MLTDVQIRKAKPAEKPYKLTDSGGLHLFITPAGGRLWRMRYEVKGKEKVLSFGPYPAVSLLEARTKRDAAKAALRNGQSPGKIETPASVDTFESIAREWHKLKRHSWVERHAADVIESLERDVFPSLGKIWIRDITVPQVLKALRAIEDRSATHTARRVRQRMSDVFSYAISSGRADADPAAVVVKAMAPLHKGRQPAVSTLDDAIEVMRKSESIPAHIETKLGLRFLALTMVRPGEIRGARWEEFEDLDGTEPLWRVPAERMKMKREHLVPLSRQAVAVLNTIKPMTGSLPYVFPSPRHAHRPMSENAMGYLLNRAGYHSRHVPHGWRSTFSTVMNEKFPMEHRIIDLMLAHSPKDKIEGAYNRAEHMGRRRELSQIWADMLMQGQMPLADMVTGPMR